MTKKGMVQKKILKLLTVIPICSTPQIANLFFRDAGSPVSRAYEALHALEVQKLIQGESRKISDPKVWRLTKKGREVTGSERAAVWLNSNKVDHYLAIGDVFCNLYSNGKLATFETELRERFITPNGTELTYSPDAYFVFNKHVYLLEVQLTPLSSDRWKRKWKVAKQFFDYGLDKAKWQTIPGVILTPDIIVISNQMGDTILTGSEGLDIKIISSRYEVSKELGNELA